MSSPGPDPAALVPLCHHRWVLPLLVAVGPAGGRFAAMMHQLEVARPTLRRALDAAVELELVAANPGYGHPLRPEYVTTAAARDLVPAAAKALAATGSSAADLVGKKWTLPVLAAAAAGATRFTEFAVALPMATPRALAGTLDALVEHAWMDRELVDGRPPRPVYRLTRSGRPPARAALSLAVAASAFR